MAKHKYIESPEDMYMLFEEYRLQVKSNPKKKLIQGNKDFVISKEDLERPLTHSGFRVFCHKKGYSIEHYFANTDNQYDDYRTICSIIKEEIRDDQINGGMIGIYNPSITQRLNGLVDRQEHTHKEQPLFGEDE